MQTRLNKIAEALRRKQVDALLLTNTTPENIQYATCFHGLEGYVLILADGTGYVLTDSRYLESAQERITPLGYTVMVPENGCPTSEALQALITRHQVKTLGFVESAMSVQEYCRFRDHLSCELTAIGNTLAMLRQYKEETELASIRAAQRIAEAAFDDLLGIIRPGMTEISLKAELEYRMSLRGSEQPSFDTILISGTKTSMPHGMPGDKTVEQGEFITIDFGAVVNGYHSDMTRTFALGHVTDEMRHVYEVVLEAQKTGIEQLAVGRTGGQVHRAAHEVITEAGYGEFFGHALGHSLGLQIHETPSVGASSRQVLESGMVVTIEPGIYLPGCFGVRIEDMLLLGTDHNENLTRTPKALLEL